MKCANALSSPRADARVCADFEECELAVDFSALACQVSDMLPEGSSPRRIGEVTISALRRCTELALDPDPNDPGETEMVDILCANLSASAASGALTRRMAANAATLLDALERYGCEYDATCLVDEAGAQPSVQVRNDQVPTLAS